MIIGIVSILCIIASPHVYASEWVLEDFAVVRYNGDSPPNYLFNNGIYDSIVNNYDLTNHWLAIPVTPVTSDHPAWGYVVPALAF